MKRVSWISLLATVVLTSVAVVAQGGVVASIQRSDVLDRI